VEKAPTNSGLFYASLRVRQIVAAACGGEISPPCLQVLSSITLADYLRFLTVAECRTFYLFNG